MTIQTKWKRFWHKSQKKNKATVSKIKKEFKHYSGKEFLRLLGYWVICAIVISFFYWLMDNFSPFPPYVTEGVIFALSSLAIFVLGLLLLIDVRDKM